MLTPGQQEKENVARTADGTFLGASAVILEGVTNPEVFKALAVREGLCLAQGLLLPKICLASDCLSVINSLKEQNLSLHARATDRFRHVMNPGIWISFLVIYLSRTKRQKFRSDLGRKVGSKI